VDAEEYDLIIRHLVQIAAHQEAINADVRASIQQQGTITADVREFNCQHVEINANIKTTLARRETLLVRMLRTEDNGR
jgi:hypothetical protein